MSNHRVARALEHGIARARLSVRGPVDPAELAALVLRCDGEVALGRALAPHAARLSLAALRDDWDGEAAVVRPVLAAWAAKKRRPAGAALRVALLQHDAEAPGATDDEVRAWSVHAPRTRGAVWRVSRPLARAVALGLFGDVRSDIEALCRWGAALVEAADWRASQDALLSLQRHAPAFAALARRTTGSARAAALAAFGVGTTREEDRITFLRRASVELAQRADPSLALVVAEAARREGQHALRVEALALARPVHPARADVIDGRARFNRADFAGAARAYTRARRTAKDEGTAALALLGEAWNERERGEHVRARAASREAAEVFEALGGELGLAQARTNEALIALAHGDARAAIAIFAPLLPRIREPLTRANAHSFAALAHELEGSFDEALSALSVCLERPGPALFFALWTLYRGRILLARGDHEAAERDLGAAAEGLASAGAGASASTALALMALRAAEGGDRARATALLRRAAALAGADPMRRQIVALARAAGAACAALAAAPGQRAPVDRRAVRWARRRCRVSSGPVSLHLRCAAYVAERVLDRALARADRHDRVELDEVTRSVRFRGLTLELARRPLLFRVMRELMRGPGVHDRSLVERVWVGEAMAPAASRNRLRVAIHELRAMGLRDAIGRDGDGYRLLAPVVGQGEDGG